MKPNGVYVPSRVDVEIAEKQRLLSERNKFYAKLTRLGYIPDDDMRQEVEALITRLEARIEALADNIIAIGG